MANDIKKFSSKGFLVKIPIKIFAGLRVNILKKMSNMGYTRALVRTPGPGFHRLGLPTTVSTAMPPGLHKCKLRIIHNTADREFLRTPLFKLLRLVIYTKFLLVDLLGQISFFVRQVIPIHKW